MSSILRRGFLEAIARPVAPGRYNLCMRIRTHHSLSLDGYSATPAGLRAITQVTEFAPKITHGIAEFGAECGAVAMGRTTFETAIGNPWWPWPGRRVHVLSSHDLPEGTPADVVHVTGGVDALRLVSHRSHPDGSIELFYERP